MTDTPPVRRALLSVSDKTDLVPFARGLREFGVEIVSTGGTARALREAGVDVVPVDAVTGFPEMMDGRVKTLHPAIHGALLGRRDATTHMEAMESHGITPIDLVCINLYPFEQTIAQADVTDAEAIEQIDIGGPAMLRSAAKNHDAVTVITSVSQYDRVIATMHERDGATTLSLRRELAEAAFMRTAEYDTAISAWMGSRRGAAFPSLLRLSYTHHADLRYGENPHQTAALYRDPTSTAPSITSARVLHGKPLSYNNILDASAALALVQDLALTASGDACAVVIKHTNACGAAARADVAEAVGAALDGDALAAYGGIGASSRTIDEAAAAALAAPNRFLEVILAPEFTDGALKILGDRWANVRLLAVPGLDQPGHGGTALRSIPGGLLVQDRDDRLAETRTWNHAAGPAPSPELIATAAFAWMTVKHLSSNAIAIAADRQLLGVGAGQVDRVGACRKAVEKTEGRHRSAGASVAVSDAFFPFDDGPRLLVDAGVTCIVQPGGSKRDEDTLELCRERGVTCLLTGVRHFRH